MSGWREIRFISHWQSSPWKCPGQTLSLWLEQTETDAKLYYLWRKTERMDERDGGREWRIKGNSSPKGRNIHPFAFKRVMSARAFCRPHVKVIAHSFKSEFLKNILVTLFNIMKVNEDWGCQITKKHHKSIIQKVHVTSVLWCFCNT